MTFEKTIQSPTKDEFIYYMEEGCGIFAYALAKTLKSGNIYIFSNNYGDSWNKRIPFEVTHVCFSPDNNIFIDAKGIRPVSEIAKDFSLIKGEYEIIGSYEPTEFKKQFMGSSDRFPLYGNSADIKEAIELIKKYKNFYLPESLLIEFSSTLQVPKKI